MEITFDELHKKTVAQLREIAREIEHDAIRGYSTMHKEPLTVAICTALGLEAHEHHEIVGIDKKKAKGQIRELKVRRDKALEAHDRKNLKKVRREIHRLKHKLRTATH